MPYRPVAIDETLLGQPLPWNLYTVSGVLIARAGMELTEPTQLAKLAARPVFRRTGEDDEHSDLGPRLHALTRSYPEALKLAGGNRLEPAIRAQARKLANLAKLDHDACLGLLRLAPIPDPATRHCLLAALMAYDMAEQMFPVDAPCIESILCAAMTMNIAAMRLHAELTEQRSLINDAQRNSISGHPLNSEQILEVSGVQDRDWLTAVHQHHENMDGSGYPERLRGQDIGMAARIIRIADYYVAKTSSRRFRPPMTSSLAFKRIFGDERKHLDSQFAQLLLRRLGLFPPGTLLRLASREIAVVTRKQGGGETPGSVVAFLGHHGRPLNDPVERNTSKADYAVLNVTELETQWPEIRWETLWGH